MCTMHDYYNMYLKSNVILLADVFEEFRKMSLNLYRMDPTHDLSSPDLNFNACLKMTKARLGFITNPDQSARPSPRSERWSDHITEGRYQSHNMLDQVQKVQQTIHRRFSDHKSNIKLKKDTLIASHFNDEANTIQHLSIIPIEQLKTNKRFTCMQWELYWIHQLMTYKRKGRGINRSGL